MKIYYLFGEKCVQLQINKCAISPINIGPNLGLVSAVQIDKMCI